MINDKNSAHVKCFFNKNRYPKIKEHVRPVLLSKKNRKKTWAIFLDWLTVWSLVVAATAAGSPVNCVSQCSTVERPLDERDAATLHRTRQYRRAAWPHHLRVRLDDEPRNCADLTCRRTQRRIAHSAPARRTRLALVVAVATNTTQHAARGLRRTRHCSEPAAVALSCHRTNCRRTWRHPQNRKYIACCNSQRR